MSDKLEKGKVRRLKWAAVGFLLLLAALLMAPFLLTTHLVRLALGQVFPASRLSLGSAVLNPSGTLVLHDLVLHETGALAQQPLVTAREVVATFGWAELFSHQIRRIQATDVSVYARPHGSSQLSLLDLFPELSRSGPAAESDHDTRPLWIDALSVQGTIHVAPIGGFVPARADWPLALHMTMSGTRMAPSHQFRVAIGETRRLPEEIAKEPSVAATEPAPNTDTAFGLLTEVETQPAAGGMRIVVHRLAARRAALTLEADALRQYLTNLPPDLQGRIEISLGNLWASGELDLQGPANTKQFVGSFGFAGVRLRMPGGSPMLLRLDDLAATGKIDTVLPPGPRTTMTLDRLQAKNIRASIEVDRLRRYATNLPAALHGRFDADLGALDVSGLVGSGMGDAMGFSGHIRLQDLSVRSPTGGKHPFALDRFAAAGTVAWQLHPWAPAALKVRDGMLQWGTLRYDNNALNNLDVSWRFEGQKLTIDRLAGEIFDGHMSGSLAWDLRIQSMPHCELQMNSIDMHMALANLAPEHLDMDGMASGVLHLVLDADGALSGALDLVFDAPGLLRIGEIDAVKRMLVGNVGLALATLALQDLKRYPFKEGRLSLESVGDDSELKIKFVRQPRREADVTPPHREIINGQEVWVGSLVVPTIDMTIPITGKSLAEILSIVSGVRALNEPVSEPHGK